MLNLGKVKIQISRDETNNIDHGESNGTCHWLRPLPKFIASRQIQEGNSIHLCRPSPKFCREALTMVLQNDILNEFQKIAPSFLWKGQWISADEWTKYIKASKGMESTNVSDVNKVLKRLAATVGPLNGDAPPMLFVNEIKMIAQVEVPNNATDVDQQVCFENKRKHIHFYYMPKEGEIPDCPTSGAAWQYFYDNNKIKSRSNCTKPGRHDENNKEQQQGNHPQLNTTSPRATAENTTNRPTMTPTPTPAAAAAAAAPPVTAAPPPAAAAPPPPPQAAPLPPPTAGLLFKEIEKHVNKIMKTHRCTLDQEKAYISQIWRESLVVVE
jgi:hypothetical protein